MSFRLLQTTEQSPIQPWAKRDFLVGEQKGAGDRGQGTSWLTV